MRHQKAGRKFKRSPSHRRMLLRNLATALLEHGKIQTTLAKAKEVQPFTEKLITLAKDGWNLNHFRRCLAVLTSKKVAFKLFHEIGPRLQGPSGRLHPDLQAGQGPPGRRRPDGRDRAPGRGRGRQGPGQAAVVGSARCVIGSIGEPPGDATDPARSSDAGPTVLRRLGGGDRHEPRSSAPRPALHLLQDRPRRDPVGQGARDRPRRRLPRHPPGQSRAHVLLVPEGPPRPPDRSARRARRARRLAPAPALPGHPRPPPAPTGST